MIPSDNRAITSAKIFLEKYFISDPSELNLIDILGCENILYKEIKLHSCQGNLIRQNNYGIINVNSSINNINKKRFIISHELGHWVMHKEKLLFTCYPEDITTYLNKSTGLEREANVFASEFLLPTKVFQESCKRVSFSFDLLSSLSEKYKVSLTTASIKYCDFGSTPVALLFCKNNVVEWRSFSSRFPFRFMGSKDLIPEKTLTSKFFESKIFVLETETHLAKTWFKKDPRVKPDQYLNEMVLPMPKIQACLTYLWEYNLPG